MIFNYENHGTKTYLVYELSSEDVLDTITLGMLTNNNIPGLAQTIFSQHEMQKFIKFNISAKVSIRQFFTGSVKRKQLIGVFTGIADAILHAENYMILPDMLMLDLDYIFTDVSSCDTVLITVPIQQNRPSSVDLIAFFKDIMFNTQFDQSENCAYVAQIINFLNSAKSLSVIDFKKMLHELSSADSKQSVASSVSAPATAGHVVSNQPVNVTPTPFLSAPPVAPVLKDIPAPKKPEPKPVNLPQEKFMVPPSPQANNTHVNPSVPKAKSNSTDPDSNAEKMSLFYLLQHYNKENAALYKAQKEAAKSGKASKDSTPKVKKPGGKEVNASNKNPAGFAVPGQNVSAVKVQSAVQTNTSIPSQPKVATVTPNADNSQATSIAPSQVKAENFGETTILGGGSVGETTVLGVSQSQDTARCPILVRERNNERIQLSKPIFRIGKERSYVDYFIGDNSAISRSHVNIIARDGAYFLVDTNSTNHTYINGSMLQSSIETKLEPGDRILLANEAFEFREY